MDMFEKCIETVLESSIVTEGSVYKKRIEKANNMSEDELRKTIRYKLCMAELRNLSDEEIKKVQEDANKFSKTLDRSEEKYLNKSTFSQLLSEYSSAFKDIFRGVTAKKEGKGVNEVDVNNGINIAAFRLANRTVKLAIADVKKEKADKKEEK